MQAPLPRLNTKNIPMYEQAYARYDKGQILSNNLISELNSDIYNLSCFISTYN